MTVYKEREDPLSIFRDLMENLPGHVYWKDSDGRYLGCNLEFSRSLHLSGPEEVIGKTDYDFLDEASAKIVAANDQRVIRGNKQLTFEEKVVDFKGHSIIYLSKKIPFSYDHNEHKVGVLGISVDITEQSAQALKNRIYLENILSIIPGHIFWTDKEGKVLGCNDQQARSAGLNSASEFIGKNTYDVLRVLKWPEEKVTQIGDQIRNNDLDIMRSEQPKVLEEKVFLNGEEKIYLSHKAPLYNDQHEVIGIIGSAVDITQLKKAEAELRQAKEDAEKARKEAEKANKAKSHFLENMRHDIRTPLTGIIGFGKLLRDEVKEPKAREYAENLVESGKILLNFMNEILETIRVTSGQLPLVKQKFDLKAKINDIIQLNQAKAREKNLRLTLHFDKQVPRYLIGDSKRVVRIVLELVTNALNFTDKGSVKVFVTLAKSSEQEKVVKISVEDTGIGISSERKEDLFVRFQRSNPNYDNLYRGAGLGLSMIKQFLDELEGEIELQSTPGKGSTFTCVIPFKTPLLGDDEETEKKPRMAVIFPSSSEPTFYEVHEVDQRNYEKETAQKSRILVIEDDCLAARAISETLLKLNCRIDLAFNGDAALKLFQKNQYDLIFMDIGMPRMNGFEVAKRMRALQREEDQMTPIIALTAETRKDQNKTCLEAGMNAVFAKPLSPEKAIDILNAFLFNNGAVVTDPSLLVGRSFMVSDHQTSKKKEVKVIDIEGTSKRIGLSPEKVFELLHIFMENMGDDLDCMMRAYDEKRWKDVAEMAHKFKGSAIYCGAPRLREVSGELENQLIAGKIEAASILYEKFLKEIKAVKRAFKKEIAA